MASKNGASVSACFEGRKSQREASFSFFRVMNSIRYTAFLLCFSFLVYGGELRELWERAFQSNPDIQAGRQRVEQSRLKHSEIEEFLDPTVYAGGGRTQRHRALPLSASSYRSLADNMWSAEAGVQVPVYLVVIAIVLVGILFIASLFLKCGTTDSNGSKKFCMKMRVME